MALLAAKEIDSLLKLRTTWVLRSSEIVRNLEFSSFGQALAFVNQVAAVADAADHHPDIDIRYNKVRLALTSHDEGGLTMRDFKLAAKIDSLTGVLT